MKKKYKKIKICALILSISTLLAAAGCVSNNGIFPEDTQQFSDKNEGAPFTPASTLNAWFVYWDESRGLTEIAKSDAVLDAYGISENVKIDGYNYFGAAFNPDGSLYIFSRTDWAAVETAENLYVTIVNDVISETGNNIQKDPKVINRILSNPELMQMHIDDILRFVNEHHIAGIELDYESIYDSDWVPFAQFVDKLGRELSKADVKLRIVLETRCPIEEIEFPQDYEYVMMVYNLYGRHSEPGPKADKAYIITSATRMVRTFENPRLAFSLGGFDWSDGAVEAVTKVEAEAYMTQYHAEPERDWNSSTVRFSYDVDGDAHEVWFADGETVKAWINTAEECGVNKFSLWRLGGNILDEVENE